MMSVVAHGVDLASGGAIEASDVRRSLVGLQGALGRAGATWRDIDLLWLSNSVALEHDEHTSAATVQEASERAITETLAAVAKEEGWAPSLIGCSVRASFFSCEGQVESDLSTGLLWVAVIGAAQSPVPVGHDITSPGGDRSEAGANALRAALGQAERAGSAGAESMARRSLGIVLTSGSGHVEGTTDIDFKECYAVGQELKAEADRLGMILSGGCASNRAPGQSQTLYFSTTDAEGTTYHHTVQHAGVVAVLPSAQGMLHLEHPYRKVSDEQLTIDFHERERYAPGRYFSVRSINGMAPSDFLRTNGWNITDEELEAMVEEHTAIPTEPKAHKVSIASSVADREAALWPNVPVWFEKEGDDVLLRLVRPEAQDSDFYLVGMQIEDLIANSEELVDTLKQNRSISSNLIAFLCESRKYVLADADRNDEAELLTAAAGNATVIGIYLNGEYSTGDFRSIGYHNYSQIGVLLVDGVT